MKLNIKFMFDNFWFVGTFFINYERVLKKKMKEKKNLVGKLKSPYLSTKYLVYDSCCLYRIFRWLRKVWCETINYTVDSRVSILFLFTICFYCKINGDVHNILRRRYCYRWSLKSPRKFAKKDYPLHGVARINVEI